MPAALGQALGQRADEVPECPAVDLQGGDRDPLVRAVVPGELAESVKDRTDPSDKVMEKGWPPPKTVALT